jgi:hypothetical protein
VSFDEIHDVEIISDAGSVRGRIIISPDIEEFIFSASDFVDIRK